MSRLKVTVEFIEGYCNSPMLVGDYLTVDGGHLIIPDGRFFCMWALQSMMPILPLLQRSGDRPGDWTAKVNQFCCPDPRGKVHFRIEPLPDEEPAAKSGPAGAEPEEGGPKC